jgi:hypothetical protein
MVLLRIQYARALGLVCLALVAGLASGLEEPGTALPRLLRVEVRDTNT